MNKHLTSDNLIDEHWISFVLNHACFSDLGWTVTCTIKMKVIVTVKYTQQIIRCLETYLKKLVFVMNENDY